MKLIINLNVDKYDEHLKLNSLKNNHATSDLSCFYSPRQIKQRGLSLISFVLSKNGRVGMLRDVDDSSFAEERIIIAILMHIMRGLIDWSCSFEYCKWLRQYLESQKVLDRA